LFKGQNKLDIKLQGRRHQIEEREENKRCRIRNKKISENSELFNAMTRIPL